MKLTLSDEEIKHVRHLLQQGEELQCVRYLEHEKHMSPEEAFEAVAMVKKVERFRSNPLSLFKAKSSKKGKFTKFFLYLSYVLFIWALGLLINDAWFIANSVKVSGEVTNVSTSYHTDEDGNQYNSDYPVFSYTYEGEQYDYTSNVSASYAIGDKVLIYIDPDDPSRALPQTFSNIFFGVMMILIWGVVIFGVSRLTRFFGM